MNIVLRVKVAILAASVFLFAHVDHAIAATKQQERKVASLAKSNLGIRYVWGGSTKRGFDCSGLVRWVFAKIGINLPHNAAMQYRYGKFVSRTKLRVGDLVFFHSLGHVGIYIGNGRFIHAPQTGDYVKISLLNSYSGYYGAKRLI